VINSTATINTSGAMIAFGAMRARGNLTVNSASQVSEFYVYGQITGGFGAESTTPGGSGDWDNSNNIRPGMGKYLLLGNDTNGPTGSADYYHVLNFEYASKDGSGNLVQFAIPYVVGSGVIYHRSRQSGTWGSWVAV
jgi:hypothetical protein